MKSAVAAALILVAASYESAQGGQANLPMSVIASSYSQTQQSVQFTVLNESNRTVTAWEVSIIAKGPDGTRLQSKGWATDSYLSAAGLTTGFHINSGETVTRSVPFAAPQDAVLVVEVTAAILSDGAAFGDPRDIEFVFRLRKRDYDTWTEILTVLREVSRSDTGLTALQASEERLTAALTRDKENPRLINALQNVRMAVADAEQGRANPVTRMQLLINDFERHLAAAVDARRATAR